jgi:hypothetical protein
MCLWYVQEQIWLHLYILCAQTDVCIEVRSVSAKRKQCQRHKDKRYKTRLYGSQKVKQLRL